VTPSSAFTLSLCIMLGSAGLVAQSKPAPTKPPPAQKPAPAPALPPAPPQVCQYITPEEAKGLLGVDTSASSAPTKGLFTSCGYTSAGGDTLTVYVSDYGLPSVAKQFFEKTREVLKTATNEDTVGVPAFMHITAPGPLATPAAPGAAAPAPAPVTPPAPAAGSAAAPQPVPGAPGVVMLLALKDHRTVKLEASGPLVTQPHQLPKLRAIITRVVTTLPAPTPPAPETPR
jgi:hypothetical protein